MTLKKNYIQTNKTLWNAKVDAHIASDFYANEKFKAHQNTLNPIELELLGNIKGKKILHLQCHFGQDTLSLARQGATVVGVDFSDKAIHYAQQMNQELDLNAQFICCNIFDLKQHLNQTFDIVFTSYGTIGWLHDLGEWASIVAHFLKPQGVFVMADFHPFLWSFDNDFDHIAYAYFNREPIVEQEQGTYADRDAAINLTSISFNHSLAELFEALLNQKFEINAFKEFDYSPYNCFNKTIEIAKDKFQIAHLQGLIPMVYALKCIKK